MFTQTDEYPLEFGCSGAAAPDLNTPESALTGMATEIPCREGDPDMWFADKPAVLEAAKAACGTCPLKDACFAAALENAEPWGVWGGEIFEQGRVIAVKRGRGRPRKVAA